MLPPEDRHRFYVRLGKNRRDRRLAGYIAAHKAAGGNISKLVKQLLYDYYTGTPAQTYQGQQPQQPDVDTRQSALSAKLRKLNFETLGR